MIERYASIPAERAAGYRASGAWPDRTLATHAWSRAERTPNQVAFHFDTGGTASFLEIAEEARWLAGGLQQRGLKSGDVVSVQLPNWREAAVINLAAAALGLVINPITPIYRSAELREILSDALSRMIFIPQTFRAFDYVEMLKGLRPDLPNLASIVVVRGTANPSNTIAYETILAAGHRSPPHLEHVDPDAPKLVIFTSGTTGRAKGVVHTHNTLQHALAESIRQWRLGGGDVMLMASPVTHSTGYLYGLEMPFMTGVPVALMEQWNAPRAVAYINQVRASVSIGATPFLQELIDEAQRQGNNLSTMRIFVCGGAAVPPQLIERVPRVTARCQAFRVFGSTEVPMVTQGFPDPSDLRLAAATDGRVAGYEIKIIAPETGALQPMGSAGEILVRGPAMMAGYLNADDTASAFDKDGFFRTGDLGYLTPENAVVITSRLKDIIIRGGENLSPKEIEDALMNFPAIKEAAVVAGPHPRLGESVCACILLRDGYDAPTLSEIASFLSAQGLARQKFPEQLNVMAEFPRTPSGKIRKDVLRRAVRREMSAQSD